MDMSLSKLQEIVNDREGRKESDMTEQLNNKCAKNVAFPLTSLILKWLHTQKGLKIYMIWRETRVLNGYTKIH